MKVLQTITSMAASVGGPSSCTHDLLQGLYDNQAHVDLLTFNSEKLKEKSLGAGQPWLHEIDDDGWSPLGFSSNMKRELDKSDYDLYHANALWSYTTHYACKTARKKNRPYILTPHGMLYPTALSIGKWKKDLMLWHWFRKDIMGASCLHVTCRQEAEYCRLFGYEGPIAIIPNAVVIPEIALELSNRKQNATSINYAPHKRVFGFLGRLHPIKKVENLLYAMDLLRNSNTIHHHKISDDFSLQIIGKFDEQYEAFLRSETKRLRLEDCVEFVGFINGQKKYEYLSRLSVLMVPSLQENFGMIVPEALICSTPVYASLGTPWEELNSFQCGWWRDNSPESIEEVMIDALSKSDAELKEMGVNGRRLIVDKYEQHKVASQMQCLYEWILNGGQKPDCLYE